MNITIDQIKTGMLYCWYSSPNGERKYTWVILIKQIKENTYESCAVNSFKKNWVGEGRNITTGELIKITRICAVI